jgi:hypothetical protein
MDRRGRMEKERKENNNLRELVRIGVKCALGEKHIVS